MKILYLVNDGPHAHNYGVDFLLTGFINVCGFENVFDWPEKDCMHLPSIKERDDCEIDSDACYPRKGHAIGDVGPVCDLVILTGWGSQLAYACKCVPSRVPVVAVDFGDTLGNFRGQYEPTAGRPLTMYCKRERPPGESFAHPLPLSYPASRATTTPGSGAPRVFYHATEHGAGDPGIPRRTIANALRGTIGSDYLDVRLYPGQGKGTRPSPEEYHTRMQQSLLGVSWNGAPNWDCNRFWENFAFGLCQVAERPRIYMHYPPIDGEHCVYVDRPEGVTPALTELLTDQDYARRIARQGHAHFLQHHSSEARAQWLIDAVGKYGS